jgi:hypothetical protein
MNSPPGCNMKLATYPDPYPLVAKCRGHRLNGQLGLKLAQTPSRA